MMTMRTRTGGAHAAERAPLAYQVRIARDDREILAALELRHDVFGRPPEPDALDVDRYDAICDHLVAVHVETGRVVGTYRLQTGRAAADGFGLYSEQEFDCSAFDAVRDELVELGRACIHPDHRGAGVLQLLWKGIADYVQRHGARYLLGCSSLATLDERIGARAYEELASYLAEPRWRTDPHPSMRCSLENPLAEPVAIDGLLRSYLALGARICGAPAVDRDFGTIDFLTLLDLRNLHESARRRFLGETGAAKG